MSATNAKKWGESKEDKLERYAKGKVGLWTAKARDVCLVGVPVCALLGFAANGSENENTTGWKVGDEAERQRAIAKERFPLKKADPRDDVYGGIGRENLHELGPYGVEGGKTPTPVAIEGCPWYSLAKSDEVKKILGREGVTGGDWYGAIEDQCAIGVANLARHMRAIREKIDPRLQWEDMKPIGLWVYALMMMSWSAGSGGCARHVNNYADILAELPEEKRWGAFMTLAAKDDSDAKKHRADEHSANRTAQKLEAGKVAARFTGEAGYLAWFNDGLTDDEREAVYATLARIST